MKYRPDVNGSEQGIFKKNKKILLRSGNICALCGGYIDKSLKFPHPMSASVDHIIPVSKGGKSTMDNLQLAHLCCNQSKSSKVVIQNTDTTTGNTQSGIPQYFDWSAV